MLSNDTVSIKEESSVGKAPTVAGSRRVDRKVRTLRAWDYEQPVRFLSSQEKADTLLLLLRGQVGVLLFHGEGKLVQPIRLGAKNGPRQVTIPAGTYFAVLTLVQESAVLEVRPAIAHGARVEWLDKMPSAFSPEAREMWRRWFGYFQAPAANKLFK